MNIEGIFALLSCLDVEAIQIKKFLRIYSQFCAYI